jgi:myo-inositol-1(or 4)-monophosphatase
MTTTRHQFILATIVEAGELLMKAREEKFTVSIKDGDARNLVTSVDLEVDAFIKKAIRETFPGDVIYSEETTGGEGESGSFWTIDPIDGTSNFSQSIPHFAVCIGYVESGVPVTGAVYNPVTRELFSFEKGKGACMNGKPITVRPIEKLADAHVLLHIGRKPELADWGLTLQRKLLSSAKKNLNLGSSALDICFVAAGRADASVYGTLTTKDIAPALGILREAGGEMYIENGDQAGLSDKAQKVFATATKELFMEIVGE